MSVNYSNVTIFDKMFLVHSLRSFTTGPISTTQWK